MGSPTSVDIRLNPKESMQYRGEPHAPTGAACRSTSVWKAGYRRLNESLRDLFSTATGVGAWKDLRLFLAADSFFRRDGDGLGRGL